MHRELGGLDRAPDHRCPSRASATAGMELVRLAPQPVELRRAPLEIRRLVEQLAVEREHLVGADHDRARDRQSPSPRPAPAQPARAIAPFISAVASISRSLTPAGRASNASPAPASKALRVWLSEARISMRASFSTLFTLCEARAGRRSRSMRPICRVVPVPRFGVHRLAPCRVSERLDRENREQPESIRYASSQACSTLMHCEQSGNHLLTFGDPAFPTACDS